MKAATHLFSSFILGVAVWAFWLRDSDYYWDEALGSWQGPYSEAQVVGCVLTYALMVAVLSTRLHPVLVTVGMARATSSSRHGHPPHGHVEPPLPRPRRSHHHQEGPRS
ncbi:MAG: hypothetical protein H7270_04085 [Dermatophilaceae bacterium]|nr:hypothetical protein [Dermatophilaceae bacterium]